MARPGSVLPRIGPGSRRYSAGEHSITAQPTVWTTAWQSPCGCRRASDPDEEAFLALLTESTDGQIRHDLNGFLEQMDQLHPSGDHWYLPLTGVDAHAQGRGLGTRLLRHGLAIGDGDALPAYLEATSPRNRDFYERHGFNVIGVIQAGASPPMWAMLREPAAEASPYTQAGDRSL